VEKGKSPKKRKPRVLLGIKSSAAGYRANGSRIRKPPYPGAIENGGIVRFAVGWAGRTTIGDVFGSRGREKKKNELRNCFFFSSLEVGLKARKKGRRGGVMRWTEK